MQKSPGKYIRKIIIKKADQLLAEYTPHHEVTGVASQGSTVRVKDIVRDEDMDMIPMEILKCASCWLS